MHVLITLSGGLISEVKFIQERREALQRLSTFVETMEPEDEDAAVYDEDGLVASAKDYLESED